MKKKSAVLKTYIAATAISFSLTVIIASLWNLFTGGSQSSIASTFFLELLAVLVLIEFVDWLLRRAIDKLWLYLTVDYIVTFVIFLSAGFLFHWFGISLKSVLICAVLFLWISALLYRYFLNKQKADSNSINKQLENTD